MSDRKPQFLCGSSSIVLFEIEVVFVLSRPHKFMSNQPHVYYVCSLLPRFSIVHALNVQSVRLYVGISNPPSCSSPLLQAWISYFSASNFVSFH